jgi:choline/glycine/proline betaine transport protein
MMFATGLSVGLFAYCVPEPLWHHQSNFFVMEGYHTQDEIDQFSIGLTITHWGITGWAEFLIIAMAMTFAQWRYDLPASFRSVFYPILGDYTFGWMGDMIDAFTMIVTIASLCTSLAIGVIQLISGFQYLGWIDENTSFKRLVSIQNVIVWWLTIFAAMSVASGVYFGMKILSKFTVLISIGVFLLVFCLEDTKYLLNTIVQQFGKYCMMDMLIHACTIFQRTLVLTLLRLPNRTIPAVLCSTTNVVYRCLWPTTRQLWTVSRRQVIGGVVDGCLECVLYFMVVSRIFCLL